MFLSRYAILPHHEYSLGFSPARRWFFLFDYIIDGDWHNFSTDLDFRTPVLLFTSVSSSFVNVDIEHDCNT